MRIGVVMLGAVGDLQGLGVEIVYAIDEIDAS